MDVTELMYYKDAAPLELKMDVTELMYYKDAAPLELAVANMRSHWRRGQ